MLVGPGGEAVGSVSGGCVEGAVYELGQEVVASGPPVLQRYGVSDDDAFAVGLTCGGILDVFVESVSGRPSPSSARRRRHRRRPPGRRRDRHRAPGRRAGGRRLVVRPEDAEGGCRTHRIARQRAGRRGGHRRRPGAARARPHRDADLRPGRRAPRRGMRVFVAAHAPARGCSSSGPSTSRPPSPVGSFLGYRVTVCDARPVFATASRFPAADEVVVEWPHRYLVAEVEAGRIDPRTVVCVLTHDPKFDVPLLEVALRLPEVAYVGAMGSGARTTTGSSGSARPACPRPTSRGCRHRSASTSAPGPRRRRPCRSPRRSSRSSGAATAGGSRTPAGRSTTTPPEGTDGAKVGPSLEAGQRCAAPVNAESSSAIRRVSAS